MSMEIVLGSVSGVNVVALVFFAGVHWQKAKQYGKRFDTMDAKMDELSARVCNGLTTRIGMIEADMSGMKATCEERGKQLEHLQEVVQ